MAFFTFPGPDPEKFFMLLANSQGRRLDDQRVSLPPLPGIKTESTTSASTAAEMDASNLCNILSKVQVGPINNVMYRPFRKVIDSFCHFIPQNLTFFAVIEYV